MFVQSQFQRHHHHTSHQHHHQHNHHLNRNSHNQQHLSHQRAHPSANGSGGGHKTNSASLRPQRNISTPATKINLVAARHSIVAPSEVSVEEKLSIKHSDTIIELPKVAPSGGTSAEAIPLKDKFQRFRSKSLDQKLIVLREPVKCSPPPMRRPSSSQVTSTILDCRAEEKSTTPERPHLGSFWAKLRVLSILPKQNFGFISQFCLSFINYQLETWRLLVDSATNGSRVSTVATNTTISTSTSSRPINVMQNNGLKRGFGLPAPVPMQSQIDHIECLYCREVRYGYQVAYCPPQPGAANPRNGDLQPQTQAQVMSSSAGYMAGVETSSRAMQSHHNHHRHASAKPTATFTWNSSSSFDYHSDDEAHEGLSKRKSNLNADRRPSSSHWVVQRHRQDSRESMQSSSLSRAASQVVKHVIEPPKPQVQRSVRNVDSDSELYFRDNKSMRSQQQASTGSYQSTGTRLHYAHSRSMQPRVVVVETESPPQTTRKDPNPTGLSSAATSTPNSINGTHNKSPKASSRVSLAGAKRRLGFKQTKGLSSLSIQRSEEILPEVAMLHSSASESGTDTSQSSKSISWLTRLQQTSQLFGYDPKVCFVEGLGIGQIASRQALVSPYLGDVQLSLSDRRGMLEVEVVRARGLQLKVGAKRLPSPYVKVYLMRDKKCLAKFKTIQVKRTLDPLYQQQFIFRDDYQHCVLQVIIWGDYGKRDHKSLMGIVQIHLNDVDISRLVIGWYRLFNAPSMASCVMSSSKSLRQTISSSNLMQEPIAELSSTQ